MQRLLSVRAGGRPSWLRCMLITTLLLATAVAAARPPLTVDAAFIRGLPPGQTVTAAFMKVSNAGSAPVLLTGATAAVAGEVQMHETQPTQEGMAGMRQHESVTIAPHSSVTFSPGGLHLMLLGLKRPLHDGERIDVTLHFRGANELRVPFTVRSVLREPRH